MLREWGVLLPALLGVLWVVWQRVALEAQPEIGDGALHFVQVLYAWDHPVLLVDHWAKPLYVLLGSPFAQLGTWGLTLFNGVVFLITVAVIMRSIPAKAWPVRWLAPVLVAISPQYLYVVYAGMTEPLFGLLTVAAVVALVSGHVRIGLVLASFTPLSRPEYIGFLPVVLVWAAVRGHWRSIAWAFTGVVVYSVIGWSVHHDLLWLMRNDPYIGNTNYGSGEWYHFVLRADTILGLPLLVGSALALMLWPILWWRLREERPILKDLLLLAVLPVVLIWAAHSYAWWSGGTGSAGLLRVFATTVPLSVFFILHMLKLSMGTMLPSRIVQFGVPIVSLFVLFPVGWNDARSHVPVPAVMVPEQHQVDRAAAFVMEQHLPGERIAYLHPHFGVVAQQDIWDSTSAVNLGSLNWSLPGAGLREHDRVVWDAHFGPNESAFPLERILNDTLFTLQRVFLEGAAWQGHAEPFSVWVFERRRASRYWVQDTLLIADIPDPERWKERIAPEQEAGKLVISGWMEGERLLHAAIDLPEPQEEIPLHELMVWGDALPGAEAGAWELVLYVRSENAEVHVQRIAMPQGPFTEVFLIPPEYLLLGCNNSVQHAERTLAGIEHFTVVRRELRQTVK